MIRRFALSLIAATLILPVGLALSKSGSSGPGCKKHHGVYKGYCYRTKSVTVNKTSTVRETTYRTGTLTRGNTATTFTTGGTATVTAGTSTSTVVGSTVTSVTTAPTPTTVTTESAPPVTTYTPNGTTVTSVTTFTPTDTVTTTVSTASTLTLPIP